MTVRSTPLIAAALALAAILPRADSASADTPPPSPAALQVIVLGSGGPGATGRASSSYVVVVAGEPRILVDAGPGSFARLGEAHLSLQRLDTVLLTHLHIDHAAELPGIVKARAVSIGERANFSVFGPVGRRARNGEAGFPSTSRFVDLEFGANGAFGYLADFAAPVRFHVQDLPTRGRRSGEAETISSADGVVIRAAAGHHGDAPAVIYRIDYAGHSVTFSGDIDATGLPALERLADHTDLLVFDTPVLDPPGSPPVLYSLHSPPDAIGRLAGRAAVRALLLSHLSPAVEAARPAVAASIARGFAGRVTFAEDGLRLQP